MPAFLTVAPLRLGGSMLTAIRVWLLSFLPCPLHHHAPEALGDRLVPSSSVRLTEARGDTEATPVGEGQGPGGEHRLDFSVATCSAGPLHSGQHAQLSTAILCGKRAAAVFRGWRLPVLQRVAITSPLQARLKGVIRLHGACSALLPLCPLSRSWSAAWGCSGCRFPDLPGPQGLGAKPSVIFSSPMALPVFPYSASVPPPARRPPRLGWAEEATSRQVPPGVQGPHVVHLCQAQGSCHQQSPRTRAASGG